MTTNQDRAVEVMRNFWYDRRYAVGFDEIADALADAGLLTPDPQPRTLKDMTYEEREACQWMQAELDGEMIVITKVDADQAAYLRPSGTPGVRTSSWFDQITPLPDLPRMVWPKDTPEVEEGVYGQALWDMITKAIRDEKEYHIDAQDYEGVKRWRDAERALRTAMETNPPKETPVPTRPEDKV